MATIGSRTFNLLPDSYLSLANEEFVRTLSIGTNWTRLRLGLLLALTPDGTNSLLGTSLAFGLCSGRTNPFGSANTTKFLGITFGWDAVSNTLTYVANGGNPYYGAGSSILRKVGGTRTLSNGDTLELHRVATNTGTLQRRSLHLLEFTKGAGVMQVTQWGVSAAGAAKDFTPAHLLDALEQPTSIAVNGEALGAGRVITGVPEDGSSPLDTVDLYWNKTGFPLEVYALAA